MTTRLALIMVISLLSACADGPGAVKALMSAGYHNIEIMGYGYPGCGVAALTSTRFHAISIDDEPVDGVVCDNVIKVSNTIKIVN